MGITSPKETPLPAKPKLGFLAELSAKAAVKSTARTPAADSARDEKEKENNTGCDVHDNENNKGCSSGECLCRLDFACGIKHLIYLISVYFMYFRHSSCRTCCSG